MIESARRLASVLESSPFPARIGLRGGDMTGDAATAWVPYAAELSNAQGFVHGGVAASLSLWAATLVAVASDRGSAGWARPISIGIHYLALAREEDLHATARVATRGRDIVHVDVEVTSDSGRPVAAGLAVLRTVAELPEWTGPAAAPSPAPAAAALRPMISPFSQSMGIDVRRVEESGVEMSMPRGVNEGLGSAVDPAALMSLADTCAAVACLPSIDERIRGSATLSLSAVFGEPLRRGALAIGRRVTEDGGVRSALVQIGADRGPSPASDRPTGRAAMTACVAYRFRAVEGS